MNSESVNIDCKPGSSQSPVAGGNGISWEQLPINMKIKVLVRLIYFTQFAKCFLRRLWTLIAIRRQIRDLDGLTDDEGYNYMIWLWVHLLYRQTFPTRSSSGDYIFCYFVHNEMVAYRKYRKSKDQNANYVVCACCASVYDINEPSFEEKYHIEQEDKMSYIRKWLQSVSRWTSVEKYIESQKRYAEQIKVEEENWFEECRRIEDQKQIEERRQLEVQLANSQLHNRNESVSLEEVHEFKDDRPCSLLRKLVYYIVSWVKEKRRDKYISSEISRLSDTSTTSSVEWKTVTDDEMSVESESAGVISGPNHGMHTRYNLQALEIGDSPKQINMIDKQNIKKDNKFLKGADLVELFPKPCDGVSFFCVKIKKGGMAYWIGDTIQREENCHIQERNEETN